MNMKDPNQLNRAFTEIANSNHVADAALTEVAERLAGLAAAAKGELAKSIEELALLVHPKTVLDVGGDDPAIAALRERHAPLYGTEAALALRYVAAGDSEDVAIARVKVERVGPAKDVEPLARYEALLGV